MIGGRGSMVVEYLRTRRVVRLVNRTAPVPEVVEMPVSAFLDRLGVDLTDPVPTRHYLLFAGGEAGPSGGLRDLVGLYDSEEAAREAFRFIRLTPAYRRGWGELVALRPGRGFEPLCWFGRARSEPFPRESSVRGGGEPTRLAWGVLNREWRNRHLKDRPGKSFSRGLGRRGLTTSALMAAAGAGASPGPPTKPAGEGRVHP